MPSVFGRSVLPSFDQREKRTKTLFQMPKKGGRSRYGGSVRANQSTASINCRYPHRFCRDRCSCPANEAPSAPIDDLPISGEP